MSWHADADLLERYAADALDDARAYSLEAHLLGCERCRAQLAPTADRPQLDRIWESVAEAVDPPVPGIVERGLLTFGVREHVARLLAATPSLRLSWLAAEAIALGFALLAATSAVGTRKEEVALLLFLVVAALLPVAGVAVAYGRGVDPTFEVGLAAPMRSFRLLLIRSTAVLGTCAIIAGAASWALPGPAWSAPAWLLPSFGLTLATLALSTYVRPLGAASIVAMSWLVITTVAAYRLQDQLATFRGDGQLFFVMVIVVSTWVLAQRRDLFEQGVEG